MPTYEYLCESCGHRFETFQHIADAPLTTCPNCSGHIHRVLFPTGIVFKGAGFYKTDSRGASSAADPAPSTHETGVNGKAEKSETSATPAATSTESSSAKNDTAPANSSTAGK